MSVFETEHLFGYDVIFFRVEQDRPMPIRHITSKRQMTDADRRTAVQACAWRDSERYDIFASLVRSLSEALNQE